jgi:hypothetical protein
VLPTLHCNSSSFSDLFHDLLPTEYVTYARLYISNGKFGKNTGYEHVPAFPEEPDELTYFSVPGLEL